MFHLGGCGVPGTETNVKWMEGRNRIETKLRSHHFTPGQRSCYVSPYTELSRYTETLKQTTGGAGVGGGVDPTEERKGGEGG